VTYQEHNMSQQLTLVTYQRQHVTAIDTSDIYQLTLMTSGL